MDAWGHLSATYRLGLLPLAHPCPPTTHHPRPHHAAASSLTAVVYAEPGLFSAVTKIPFLQKVCVCVANSLLLGQTD